MTESERMVFDRLMFQIRSDGGKARAKKLSARRRKQIARDAAKARWAKDRKTA